MTRADIKAEPPNYDSYDFDDDEEECPRCHGDGMDPLTDFLLPCPMCQRCHLTYDADHHRQTAYATRKAAANTGDMFATPAAGRTET